MRKARYDETATYLDSQCLLHGRTSRSINYSASRKQSSAGLCAIWANIGIVCAATSHLGAEITLVNGGGHLTLLAENDTGYANLCRLITLARRDQQKGFAALPWRLLADHHTGLIALSGCRRSEIARALLDRHFDKAQHATERFASIFGAGNFFLELQRHHERGDRRLNDGLVALAQRLRLPLVATGNVHYRDTDDAPIHDVLTCIRQRVPLAQANGYLRSNHEYRFRSPQEMAMLFADQPAGCAQPWRSRNLARCSCQAAHSLCR